MSGPKIPDEQARTCWDDSADAWERFTTVQYRYTLEQWSRTIEAAGFCITALREPRPSAEVMARRPGLAAAARLPFFLVFELRSLGAVRGMP